MFVTDKGLEGEFDKYLTPDDKKNYVLARFHFGGWWFRPNRDTNGKIVSTACFAAVCSDPGGKIPKWLIKVGSPQTAQQSIQMMCDALREHKINAQNEEYK